MSLRTRALLALAVAVTLSGCASTPHPSTGIGMAKIGLNRAFTDPALKPLPPNVIVHYLPVAPEVLANPYAFVNTITPPPTLSLCPKAPPTATVDAQAPITIVKPPAPGFYRLVNAGTIAATTAGITVKFPYPPLSYLQVSDVNTVDAGGVPGVSSSKQTQFTVTTFITKTYVITETYQYDATSLHLIHRKEENSGAVVSDDWTPPVEEFAEAGVGSSWDGIATHLAGQRVLSIHGDITKHKVVDACGKLVDTLEAQTQTTIADGASHQTSGTTTGMHDIADVGTALGGLFVVRETHTTSFITVNNVPVTLQVDVTSTMSDLVPSPKAPGA